MRQNMSLCLFLLIFSFISLLSGCRSENVQLADSGVEEAAIELRPASSLVLDAAEQESGKKVKSASPEPPALPLPDEETLPPCAPGSDEEAEPTDEQRKELLSRYGISITGSATELDVENALVSARQFRPEDTKSLRINYAPFNRRRGVMGLYILRRGDKFARIEMYDHVNLHTVFHEIAHHITIYPRNGRAIAIAEQVLSMVPPARGNLAQASPQYIPREYARTNKYEFYAEFFTFLREKEKGIEGGYPCSPSFNPSAKVREVARQIFAED